MVCCNRQLWFQGGFQVQANQATSQRGIRSVVSSVYDPFGLAAPFVLPAKQLLQDSCRMKLQWDNPVPSEQKVYWEKWLVDRPNLSQFSVGRCIQPVGFNVISSSQRHHFSDASEVGFGSVSYLCLVNNQRDIHCSSLCRCYCKSKIHEQFADDQLQSYARENGLVTKEQFAYVKKTLQPLSRYLKWSTNGNGQRIKG